MAKMQIRTEMIRMPNDAGELARLTVYLNQKYGADGWACGGVTTVASSSALLFVFQRPTVSEDFLTDGGAAGGEAPGDAPGPARRRRGGGGG